MARRPSHGAAGFFVLRVPLLPHRAVGGSEEAGGGDRLARLRAIAVRPEVQEALSCASPSFAAAVAAWLHDPTAPRARRVPEVLQRYVARLAARATPFGLFSSTAVGIVGPGPTRLLVASRRSTVRRTRLDMHHLAALVDDLTRIPQLRDELRFAPSTALHRAGDQLHVVQPTVDEGGARFHHLVAVTTTPVVDDALAACRAPARIDAIVDRLVALHSDLDRPGVRDLVLELVALGILVSELEPPVTGDDPLDHVIAILEGTRSGRDAASVLTRVRDELTALDRGGVGQGPERYRRVAELLGALPTPVDRARLVQVDLFRPAAGSRLGPDVVGAIERGVGILALLGTRREPDDLRRFRERFQARFGSREVPMTEALDDERGVGFGSSSSVVSPLLDGAPFPDAPAPAPSAHASWLLGRLLERGRDDGPLDLDDDAIARWAEAAPPPTPLPDTFAVVATVAARSARALDAGELQVLVRPTDLGGAAPFGRFCHGDAALAAAVAGYLRAEEARRPGVLMAEIAHVPEGRAGNVVCRPVLRDHEIPYVGRSGAPLDRQIPLDDLLVSIDGDAVRLRSRSRDRWVQPCLGTALAPRVSPLPIYRFLCALARPAPGAPSWDWGALAAAPRLPRVTAGRVVLALARWRLGPTDLAALAVDDGAAAAAALHALRLRLALPRWITVSEREDQVLPVDLDDPLAVAGLIADARGRREAVWTELFPAPEELVAEGEDGRYVAELVVPFQAVDVRLAPRRTPLPRAVLRRGPGSEWLAASLEVGPSTGDAALRALVGPLVRGAERRGEVDLWSFTRGEAPAPSVRLRLHGRPEVLGGVVLPALHRAAAPWLDDGRVHRLTIDTVEIEGADGEGGGVGTAARLEAIESDVTLRCLELLEGPSDADVQWRLAVVGVDGVLGAFGLDDAARRDLLAARVAEARSRGDVDAPWLHAMGRRFRDLRAELEALLDGGALDAPACVPRCIALLRGREPRLRPLAEEVARAAEGEGAGARDAAIASLVAGFVARMLPVRHRHHELALLELLRRAYDARRARSAAR